MHINILGENGSELPEGATSGICPSVESCSLSRSHLSASGGDDNSNPGSKTQRGEIEHTLDNIVATAAEKDTDSDPSKVKTEEGLGPVQTPLHSCAKPN